MLKSEITKAELIEHPYPSASRIIRGILPQFDFSKIPKHILENAIDRGNWVHEAIEDHIQTNEYESRWEWQSYMDAFHDFEKEYDPTFLATEYCVVAPQKDSKGIIDAICEIDGQIYILDFKTSSKATHVSWKLQLMIYVRMLVDYPDAKIGVVQLKNDGTFTFHQYDYNLEIVDHIIKVYQYLKDNKEVE